MRAARVELVGRRRELTSLRRWLVSVDATPHAMLILGEPGMGKTTLWFALLGHAEALGTTVAVSRPSRPESRLAFLVLADLLDDLITAEPEEFSALPEVQRDLLDAVRTGVATPGAQTWRGVAVAFLELLRSAATVRPVLLAIDDRQWSDASSARVLDFALSRCGEQPVRLLATQRLGLSERTSPADPDLMRLDAGAMVLGPLPETDLMRMLRRIGPVPPEVAAAAVDGSGANPFVALELARSLLDPPITGGRNPLPRSLHDIAGSRLRGLSDHGLIVCRLTCMVGRPTTRTLHGILGRDTADAGLDDAEAAGVLELRDGLWAFRHPLLAAAVHDLIAPAVRRDLHARASTVVDDREERAWHLVEAATGPDEAVATEVTATARWLAERGAPDNALSLLAAAIRLEQDATPDTRAARQVDAAHALLALDRPAEAMDTARAALELADDPTVSARALQICAAGATELDGPDTAVTYLEQAMTLAADPAMLVPIADDLGVSLFSLGRVTEATACFVGNAERARLLGDPALVAETRA
ncbi:MAG TPA: tetratricopeptide repeat protein, partial [Actinomycetes bacterium]|nr:tetratricopeptide repeat protein [Actinomycetes bacterium]